MTRSLHKPLSVSFGIGGRIDSEYAGISGFMRRLLTGYAITYNQRHRRHGHLFQNRYKSIVCDENTYFAELVRYIHLNPARAKQVKTLSELNRYRYCGHSVLMGRVKYEWQDRDYVLKWFGNKEKEAVKSYREFVKERKKDLDNITNPQYTGIVDVLIFLNNTPPLSQLWGVFIGGSV